MATLNSGRGVAPGLVALACLLAGCAKAPESGAPPPPTVTVSAPIQQRLVEWDHYTGRLEPVEAVDVRARVSGYLQSIHFEDGRKVEAGDLLFIIDPRPFQAVLDAAEARLAQANAGLALAEANYRRARELLDRNAIAVEEHDQRQNEFLEADANVMAAEAEVETARLNLSFTRVEAPISGITGRHLVTEGNLITGGAAQSTLLVTIIPHDPIYCYFEIDERNFLKYVRLFFEGHRPGRGEEGDVIEMALADEEGFPHKGKTDFGENRLDPGTSTLRVRGVFENPGDFLTPGLFARVRVPGSAEYEAILIRDEAVGTDQAQKFVWVIGEGGAVQFRPVELGPMHEGLRIVRSGLSPEDRVVVRGMQFLRSEMTVNTIEEPMNPEAAPNA